MWVFLSNEVYLIQICNKPPGGFCSYDIQCNSASSCLSGICTIPPGTTCSVDSACYYNNCDVSFLNVCGGLLTTCTSNIQCTTGFCGNGRC